MNGSSRSRGPKRPYPRIARVNALLLEVVAEHLERLADADERLRLVTVTGVVCETDLRQATVYVASLSADSAEALEEHRRALQRSIGREVRMKHTPLLAFSVDPAIEAGAAVEAALRRAKPIVERPDSGDGDSGDVDSSNEGDGEAVDGVGTPGTSMPTDVAE